MTNTPKTGADTGLPAAGTLRLNLNMLFDPKTALQRGETLFFGDAIAAVCATPEPAGQAEPSPKPRRHHHSEQTPYHRAMYLNSLLKSASWLADDNCSHGRAGLTALLHVICERAADLESELDCEAGCDGWQK